MRHGDCWVFFTGSTTKTVRTADPTSLESIVIKRLSFLAIFLTIPLHLFAEESALQTIEILGFRQMGRVGHGMAFLGCPGRGVKGSRFCNGGP